MYTIVIKVVSRSNNFQLNSLCIIDVKFFGIYKWKLFSIFILYLKKNKPEVSITPTNISL